MIVAADQWTARWTTFGRLGYYRSGTSSVRDNCSAGATAAALGVDALGGRAMPALDARREPLSERAVLPAWRSIRIACGFSPKVARRVLTRPSGRPSGDRRILAPIPPLDRAPYRAAATLGRQTNKPPFLVVALRLKRRQAWPTFSLSCLISVCRNFSARVALEFACEIVTRGDRGRSPGPGVSLAAPAVPDRRWDGTTWLAGRGSSRHSLVHLSLRLARLARPKARLAWIILSSDPTSMARVEQSPLETPPC
jgi:hypothetical protein